ncbi:MAG: hypothetical protein J2P19_02380 [Pseudonocardia sp.]|nr:hypothetical protein [Pseudonocardia sp.]
MIAASLYETITVALARTFDDGECGFTGLTTGRQAALYGTSMPLAAMALARATHAPNLTILFAGWSVNPDTSQLRRLPDMEFDSELTELPCEAQVTDYPNPIGYKRGDVDFGFSSGVQVDQWGCLNSVRIGPPERPKVRLVGPILQPEHFTLFGREYIMMPRHDRRCFVEQVDYASGVGFPGGRHRRRELGLPDTGPALVVSPLGFFDFDDEGRMRARSLHPGVDADQVASNTAFEPRGLAEAPVTEPPTKRELSVLRQVVDPRGVLVPPAQAGKASE